MLRSFRLGALLALSLAALPPASGQTPVCSDGEAAARDLTRAYVEGWLRGDPEAVLATLAPDAVILPAGVEPIVGHERMRAFWWPDDGSTTTITDYAVTLDEVYAAGDLAYSRGRGEIAFTYARDGEVSEHTNASVSLTVYRCDPETGRWHIARRMWSPLRP